MSTIHFEDGITQEQKWKVLFDMVEEKKREVEWAHQHTMWKEAKGFVEFYRPEILKQLKKKISG